MWMIFDMCRARGEQATRQEGAPGLYRQMQRSRNARAIEQYGNAEGVAYQVSLWNKRRGGPLQQGCSLNYLSQQAGEVSCCKPVSVSRQQLGLRVIVRMTGSNRVVEKGTLFYIEIKSEVSAAAFRERMKTTDLITYFLYGLIYCACSQEVQEEGSLKTKWRLLVACGSRTQFIGLMANMEQLKMIVGDYSCGACGVFLATSSSRTVDAAEQLRLLDGQEKEIIEDSKGHNVHQIGLVKKVRDSLPSRGKQKQVFGYSSDQYMLDA